MTPDPHTMPIAAPLEAANKRVEELEEAVRALAGEVSEWHRLCIDARAYDDRGWLHVSKIIKMLRISAAASRAFDDAVNRTHANPTARAAIEAAKAGGGA